MKTKEEIIKLCSDNKNNEITELQGCKFYYFTVNQITYKVMKTENGLGLIMSNNAQENYNQLELTKQEIDNLIS